MHAFMIFSYSKFVASSTSKDILIPLAGSPIPLAPSFQEANEVLFCKTIAEPFHSHSRLHQTLC